MTGDFILILHPSVAHDLTIMLARARWKDQDHRRRWEKRYGRSYPKTEGEMGSLEKMNFIWGENMPK